MLSKFSSFSSYRHLITPTFVPELTQVKVTEQGIQFGAAVTLSVVMTTLKSAVQNRPAEQTSSCAAIAEQLKWFAGTQVSTRITWVAKSFSVVFLYPLTCNPLPYPQESPDMFLTSPSPSHRSHPKLKPFFLLSTVSSSFHV